MSSGRWRSKELFGEPPKKFLDPYFVWAERSQWRGFERWTQNRVAAAATGAVNRTDTTSKSDAPETTADPLQLRLLIERKDEKAAPFLGLQPIPCYQTWLNKGGCFFTLTLPVTAALLEGLRKVSSDHYRWELALPQRAPERLAHAYRVGYYGPDRERSDFRERRDLGVKAGEAPTTKLTSALAVIDFGVPVLHQSFARRQERGGRLPARPAETVADTRIAAVWDQGGGGKPEVDSWPWSDRAWGDHGRVLYREPINELRQQVWGPAAELDELTAYACIDHLVAYHDARRRVWRRAHGSHVLDLLGGNVDPLLDTNPADTDPLPDAAAQADLLFVQLPTLTSGDASGGSLGAQILDGVHFVLDQCQAGAPLVINISYGSQAGPHRGQSMIERALDEVLKKRENNLAIVLAAGNGQRADAHVRRRIRAERSALLQFWLAPGDSTDSFVELWFDEGRPAVEIRVRTGQWDWSPWLKQDEQTELQDRRSGRPIALLRHQADSPRGQRSMALLALCPTMAAVDDDGPLAPAGVWEIELRLVDPNSSEEAVVDAWIQRDELGEFDVESTQSHFLGVEPEDRSETLSSMATGKYTIAVGALSAHNMLPTAYSARGSRAANAVPLHLAVAERSPDEPGLRAAAVRSGETFLMNGSSVAAPVLARRIYNLMMGSGSSQGQTFRSTDWKSQLLRSPPQGMKTGSSTVPVDSNPAWRAASSDDLRDD